PATWQLSASDSTATALQVAGPVGLESFISSTATNAPVTIRYDNFSARVPQ
ncbi:MAG: hypothetical protein JWO18_225, partial [Microbacteriaceae bacterium]|nr:hypothetical protein [Microbacteriaceae bacterium]